MNLSTRSTRPVALLSTSHPALVRAVLWTVALLLATLGSLSSADAQESRWQMRLHGILVDGDQAFSVEDSQGNRVLAGGNAELGLGASVEYRLTDRIGFELGAASAGAPDFETRSISSDDTVIGSGPDFTPLTFGLNFHLTPSSRFDVYFGPTLAFVQYGDFDLDLGDEVRRYEADDEISFGGTLGVDMHFGDGGWALNAAVTYLASDLEVAEKGTDSTVEVPFDPLIVQVGFTYSF